MLYHYLMNSLSRVGKYKVSVWNSPYKFNRVPSGKILLKVIIQEIHLNNNTEKKSITTQLISLDAYIGTIGCDITKFNTHVKLLLAGLSICGEISNDLLTKLFKGYKAASDSVFFKYIDRNQYMYEDGKDRPTTALMLLAENKFKIF